MKRKLTRSHISLCIAAILCTPLAHSAELTGYSSEHSIPYSLFEETETARPWVKPAAPAKKPLRPATTQNLQQTRQLQALQQSLAEQQRINQSVRSDHQREKQALEAQLKTLQDSQIPDEAQKQQYEQLQRDLTLSIEENSNARQSLAEMRTQLAAHQLLVDTHALHQSSLTEKLSKSEQQIAVLTQQLIALSAEKHTLQTQQPGAQQLAEIKQHQEKITQLELSLNEAQQHKSGLESELNKLQQARLPALPQSHEQKLAYANGVAFASNIVQSLRAQQDLGVEPDRPMVLAGIKDAFDQRIALNSDELSTLVSELDSSLNDKLQVQQKQAAVVREQQLKQGSALIAATRKRQGVKELEGALYIVSKKGTGAKLTEESTVELLISGRLPDGTVFDSTGQENKVQRVKLNTLLPALTTVLSQVNAGSELEVILPPEQAFGDSGVDNLIPGGATLIFDLKINKVE